MFTSRSDQGLVPNRSSRREAEAEAERDVFRSASLIDPVYVIGRLWKARFLILLCAILGAGIAAAIAMATPKQYTATAQVLVDPRDIKVVQNEVTPNGLPSDATLALIESQTAVVHSNEVLRTVIAKADLLNDTDFNGKGFSIIGSIRDALGLSERAEPSAEGAPLTHEELVTLRNLRRNMSAVRETKSFVLNLSITSTSPEKSAMLANLLAETFITELGEVQSSTARRASDALSSRLDELRARVSEAERAVETYKAENGLVGVGGRLVGDDYILRINDQLARSSGDVTTLRNRVEQMDAASVDDVVEGSFPEELTSEALNRLRDNYSALAQEQAVLSASLGPRHPRRIANEEAMSAARSAIRGEIGRIVAANRTELARAESTDRDLNAQLDELKSRRLATSGSFVKLRELEREVEASRAIYEAFLLRARETGEQERLNTANVRVISAATPPLDPSSMSRRVVVMIGFVAGLLAGLGLVLIQALWAPMRRLFAENEARYAPAGGLAAARTTASTDPDAGPGGGGEGRGKRGMAPVASMLPGLRASDTAMPERALRTATASAIPSTSTSTSTSAADRSDPETEASAPAPLPAAATTVKGWTLRGTDHADASPANKSETGSASAGAGSNDQPRRMLSRRLAAMREASASEVTPANISTAPDEQAAFDAPTPATRRLSARIRSVKEGREMQSEVERVKSRLTKLRGAIGGEDAQANEAPRGVSRA
ncbi:hypothetical protein DYI37_08880 [Fulvimarina endophytica]|uniref:ATP-grasp domain-containing protein n=1 Tax=Fulvimarina endophytica TaxID=2293836 RepID=A0A371X5U7_9HYPH|nr:GumC family protein [Fulvimarina endophytica]RFC64414.1 hypothetical protein DYI37_08880 [Fulvimarina endophytica]